MTKATDHFRHEGHAEDYVARQVTATMDRKEYDDESDITDREWETIRLSSVCSLAKSLATEWAEENGVDLSIDWQAVATGLVAEQIEEWRAA